MGWHAARDPGTASSRYGIEANQPEKEQERVFVCVSKPARKRERGRLSAKRGENWSLRGEMSD